MRAKEEILYQHLDAADIMYTKGKYIDDQDVEPIIFKAMDEYAKETAIAFAKWRLGLPSDYIKRIKNPELHLPIEEQLFNQFLTIQNHK